MNEQEEINKVFEQVINLQNSGEFDSDIEKALMKQGISKKVSSEIIEVVNKERNKAQRKAEQDSVKNSVLIQIGCAIACPLSAWGFVELKSLPYNLVPLNIGPINIIDTILLTVLGSIALSALFTFFAMFKTYID